MVLRLFCNNVIRYVICKGWFSKLILRLEIVKFRRNVFKGFDSVDVFFKVWMVRMFSIMVG